MAGPASTDVPDRYDVVFSLNDGTTYGFLYADSVESNLPFRTHKALYSYSPTFLERQNLSNTYGDNFQDFFLTGTQADFSEGEGQKFFRVNDQDSVRKYWAGQNIDPITTPGNVSLTTALTSLAQGGVSTIICGASAAAGNLGDTWWMADVTNLYDVTSSGTVTLVSAHGAGTPKDIAVDESNIYIAGTTALRMNNGAWSTFSATLCSKIIYANNTLFGYVPATDSFVSFDTAGTATTQFQWKNANGTSVSTSPLIGMAAYGGSIYLLRQGPYRSELWVYDGSGVRKQADLPPDFYSSSLCVNAGVVYIGGYFRQGNAARFYPQVYYYVNGSIGKLWDSSTRYFTTEAAMGIDSFGDGIVFCDLTTNNVMQYSISLGGVHCIANLSNPANKIVTANTSSAFLTADTNAAHQYIYGITTSYVSSGYIQTSQYDFDNTLSKVFRGIKFDADIPANTSVDLAYQLDGAGGTYTSLQTGASSGTEYLLPASTTGHSISVKITLNSATGSATPTLKHVYVRAAPILQQFRKREYLFDLSGGAREDLGKVSRRTRDMTAYPKDPITACNDLAKIATQTIPFTVYDRFTTAGMTVVSDLQQNQAGYDGFAIYEVRPNVFIGRLNLREV